MVSKYKKGDTIVVLSGKDKGKTGKIAKVLPKKSLILVEEINIVKKHVKPTKDSDGGIKEIALPFHWSKAKISSSGGAVSKNRKTVKKVTKNLKAQSSK